MGRWGKPGWAVLGIIIAAAIVVAILGSTGKDDKSDGDTSAIGTTTQEQKAPAPKPKGKRQQLRKGSGKKPDRPARGTGALLAIADQKPETFSDPLFRSLGVARSRLNTPWNSIFTEPDRLDAWLKGAQAAGIEPLVAFEHARGDACPAQPCRLPSVTAYTKAVAAFHAKYPWVRLLQPWNEANSATQPTGTHPERAAAYLEALKKTCPSCIITGADVLDSSNLDRWLRRFRAGLTGRTPRLWGLHNYTDTNRFRTSGTKRMLALVPGEVWLTEAGGIVSFKTSDGRTALPYDERRAARAVGFLLHLAALSPRITRIYIYQWKIDFPGNRFDAGLVGPDGKPRPALRTVLQHRSLLR